MQVKIAQADPDQVLICAQCDGWLRNEHLAAMGCGTDARGAVNGDTDVAAAFY